MKAYTFVPGHVTGFFWIQNEAAELRKRGSRGAGICLSLGVNTKAEVSSANKQKIEVFINGKKAQAPVTALAVNKILGDELFDVRISSELDLPQAQGFGMSGAGALSASLALAKALDLSILKDEVVCSVHEAEITCGTGLGDVMPQSLGGVVIRRKEGCLNYGIIENMDVEDVEIVLCIIGKELPTKEIITDPNHKKRINKYGSKCLDELMGDPTLENMMRLSLRFSKKTGLLSSEVERAINAASKFGMASMSMLGNSVFAVGDTQQLVDALIDFGEVYVCKIDKIGGRIIEGG